MYQCLCYAALLKKCDTYAHEIVKLCSKMCLTDHDTGLIFACSTRKRPIRLDRLIGRADGIDELAVLGQSLDSVGCSLSVDSLIET